VSERRALQALGDAGGYRGGPARNERQALEKEWADLPGQLATYQTELDATAPEHTARRDRLSWQIRWVLKRMVEIEARLAALRAEQ
jgi:hypothetical protein